MNSINHIPTFSTLPIENVQVVEKEFIQEKLYFSLCMIYKRKTDSFSSILH